MDILYERIRELRIAQNMTQEDLALRVGYTGRSAVNRVERGLVDLPRNKITDFAKALGVTEMYLMGLEDSDNLEAPLLKAFRELNTEGKEVAVNLLNGLVAGGQYQKNIIKMKWWRAHNGKV